MAAPCAPTHSGTPTHARPPAYPPTHALRAHEAVPQRCLTCLPAQLAVPVMKLADVPAEVLADAEVRPARAARGATGALAVARRCAAQLRGALARCLTRRHAAPCPQVVGVDEGQFFPDLVEFCDSMANAGKQVVVAALDGDFLRQPFGDILRCRSPPPPPCPAASACAWTCVVSRPARSPPQAPAAPHRVQVSAHGRGGDQAYGSVHHVRG